MGQMEFYKAIQKDFFEEKSMTVDDLKVTISSVMPVFGEIKTSIESDNEKISITFIDEDKYQFNGKEYDSSVLIVEIFADKESGIIQGVQHNISGLFTPINKHLVLFLASLIDKKILWN